jgi:hypothetical protein
MDLTTSSAVNLPIVSASFRLVVVCMGVRSIRCTYSGWRVPTRFVFTTNLVVFMIFATFILHVVPILCLVLHTVGSVTWWMRPEGVSC